MRVHGVAKVVQPPETKETKSGHTMLKLRLMDRNSRKRTQFWDGIVWGEKRVREYLDQGIAKDSMVYCDGEIRQDEWGDDGAKKISFEINLNELVILGDNAALKASAPKNDEQAETPAPAPVETTQSGEENPWA